MNGPHKILIVEDEAGFEVLIRQRFRREIKEGIYSFFFTRNGQEALSFLDMHPDIYIVLSDINMPGMDGLTLLANLRTKRPDIRTVIVSAYGDMPRIRAAMNLGAFDFVTKPFDIEDLKVTIRKTIGELELIRQATKARELEQINEQLRQVDRMKTEFLTNVSHEFRTPVMVINGMADQVLANPDRWLKKGINLIKRNSSRLLDLVNQLLELTQLDDGSVKLNLMRGDVVEYLTQVVEPFYDSAESKNISLSFVPKISRLDMHFDPEKLQRALTNLLSNALKFNSPGGKIQVEIARLESPELIAPPASLSDSMDWLAITVKDTGVGIPADRQPFIFDRFYQVDSSTTRSGEGTGLGLALVKELLELMNGRIFVLSEVGEGATFQVALPIDMDRS